MKMGTRRHRMGIMAVLAALLVLSGCFSGNDRPKTAPLGERDSEKHSGTRGSANTLRIGILTGEAGDRYYREAYTDIYEYMHPELNIEIVPAVDTSRYRYLDPDSDQYRSEAPLDALEKLTEGDNPVDVLILDPETLRAAIQHGWTERLTPFMEKTGEKEEEFAPAVIDGLKELADGELHALAPEYTSSALYYNVDWFERGKIKLPEDGLTWDEAFALARAASGEDAEGEPVYGLSFTQTLAEDPLWAIRVYTDPLGLSTFDSKKAEMTVNTPQWLEAWTKLAEMTRQEALPLHLRPESEPDRYDPFGGDLFLSGNAAMVIADSSYAADLQTASRNAEQIDGFDSFEWETVTLPVHPGREGIGAGIKLGDTFSIAASSDKQETAWAFIRFVTGEQMQAMELHDPYRMPSRLSAIAQEAETYGYRGEAFTQLRPAEPIAEREEKIVQENPQLWQISDSGRQLFQRVLQGELPAKQALEQWENDGRRWLKGPFTEDGTLTFGEPSPWNGILGFAVLTTKKS